MATEGVGPLDLRDADLKGFDALEAGRYNAEIFEMKWDATKGGENAKLPAGSPLLKIQFKLISDAEGNTEGIENRRAFTQYAVPPKGYDAKKAATMKGMIARFFMAAGDSEETVKSAKFNPDFEDYIGKPLVVTLSKVPKYRTKPEDGEWENRVTGVRPAGDAVPTGGLL